MWNLCIINLSMLHRVEGSFNMFAYSDEIKEMIRTDTIEPQNENKTVEEEKTDSEVADGATDEETKELKVRANNIHFNQNRFLYLLHCWPGKGI